MYRKTDPDLTFKVAVMAPLLDLLLVFNSNYIWTNSPPIRVMSLPNLSYLYFDLSRSLNENIMA